MRYYDAVQVVALIEYGIDALSKTQPVIGRHPGRANDAELLHVDVRVVQQLGNGLREPVTVNQRRIRTARDRTPGRQYQDVRLVVVSVGGSHETGTRR